MTTLIPLAGGSCGLGRRWRAECCFRTRRKALCFLIDWTAFTRRFYTLQILRKCEIPTRHAAFTGASFTKPSGSITDAYHR